MLKDRIALIKVELDETQTRKAADVLATELEALKWLLWITNESLRRHIDPEGIA